MRYHKPTTFADAATIAAGTEGITRFLAGGTDVLVQMRSGRVQPDDMIDIKGIPGVLDASKRGDVGWTIRAAVPGIELGRNADLCVDWPGVAEGMELVGSTQVQGRASLAGNLCNGSPAADGVPGLMAAGATVTVVGPDGEREIAVEDVPAGPFATNLAKGEVVASINLPPRGENGGDAYLRFIPRTEMDIAVVGAAVNLRLDGDTITEARVSLGAVAPTVLLVEDAAKAIIGTTLDDDALAALDAAAQAACNPIDDKRGTIAFRTEVAGVLARRAAKIAYDRAKGAGK